MRPAGLVAGFVATPATRTCIRNEDSRLLAFLVRLEIGQMHEASSGHSIGGSWEQQVQFHLADQGTVSTGLAFEAWEKRMKSTDAKVVKRSCCGLPPRVPQSAHYKWSAMRMVTCTSFFMHHPLNGTLAEKLDLASGTEAMQALSCVGFQETTRQAALGGGMKYLTSFPTTVDKKY